MAVRGEVCHAVATSKKATPWTVSSVAVCAEGSYLEIGDVGLSATLGVQLGRQQRGKVPWEGAAVCAFTRKIA